MPSTDNDLGKPIAVYGIAPAYLQRAIFIVILSFLFFLAMMFAYFIRQSLGYFLLASAFLVLYIVTLFSWVMQRRNIVTVYENGMIFKGHTVRRGDVVSVGNGGTVVVRDGKSVVLPKTIGDFEKLLEQIRGLRE